MPYVHRGEHSANTQTVQTRTKPYLELDTVVIKSEHSPDGYQVIDAADFNPETMELFNGMFRHPGE
jgi:hypothetical protein